MSVAAVLSWLPPALDEQLQRDAGISYFEYQVMSVLSESEGLTLRMSDLAALVKGSLTRLSRVVDRLERPGWVRRETDPSNGRYVLVALTAAGREKVAATAPAHVHEVRRVVLDPLSRAQIRQLRSIATRVGAALNPGVDLAGTTESAPHPAQRILPRRG